MNELTGILQEHAQKYPLMEPTDAVKLIYQNEFGGGHMIRNEDACMDYLRREYAAIEKDPNACRSEDIGNGILRVHLTALSVNEIERLGHDFIRSAQAHKGALERFLEKLSLLRELTAQGLFSFDLDALDRYLAHYQASGYPAVSHSETYRQAYRPAYRIVRSTEYWR